MFVRLLVEEVIGRIPRVVVGFLCEVSIVLILKEVILMLICVVVVIMVKHVGMTVGVVAVGIRSVGVKTVILMII